MVFRALSLRKWRQLLKRLQSKGVLSHEEILPWTEERVDRVAKNPASGDVPYILSAVKRCRARTFLDAGCGGTPVPSFKMAKQGLDVVAVDRDPVALRFARILQEKCFPKALVRFCQCDIQSLPFHNESFDIVYGGGVLEHFSDPSSAVNEYVRVLKPGGMIVTSVTNLFCYEFYRDLRRVIRGQQHWRNRWYTPRSAKRMLSCRGMRVLTCKPYGEYERISLPKDWVRSWKGALVRSTLGRLPGMPFGYGFLMLIAQKPEASHSRSDDERVFTSVA